MHAEAVVAAMLAGFPGATVALEQAPQPSSYPLLIYTVISDYALASMCGPATTWQARVQINPVAAGPAAVNALHDQARALLQSFGQRSVGAHTVLACVHLSFGPWDKQPVSDHNTVSLWTKPADYMLTYR